MAATSVECLPTSLASAPPYTQSVEGSVSRVSVDHGLIVLPKRQKLLYPKVGNKLSDDSLLLSRIRLKRSLKMTMIGTTEDDIIVDQVTSQDIVDDFELGKDEVG
ncbi:hypothetical protein YC2023_086844 [Brassica napus]